MVGRPSGLRPGFRPARNFTSAGIAGDLVAGVHPPLSFTQAREWFFEGAAELPLGADLYVTGQDGTVVRTAPNAAVISQRTRVVYQSGDSGLSVRN